MTRTGAQDIFDMYTLKMPSMSWLKHHIRLKSLAKTCLSLKVNLRNMSGKHKLSPKQSLLFLMLNCRILVECELCFSCQAESSMSYVKFDSVDWMSSRGLTAILGFGLCCRIYVTRWHHLTKFMYFGCL